MILKQPKLEAETPALMQELISVMEEITDFTSLNTETTVKDWMTKMKLNG
jgi:glutamyl-tRNA synthetase